MAKVKFQSAIKHYTCTKCNSPIIPKRNYLRIVRYRSPDEIRCVNCKPEPHETESNERYAVVLECVHDIGSYLKAAKQSVVPGLSARQALNILTDLESSIEDDVYTIGETVEEFNYDLDELEESIPNGAQVDVLRDKVVIADEVSSALSEAFDSLQVAIDDADDMVAGTPQDQDSVKPDNLLKDVFAKFADALFLIEST